MPPLSSINLSDKLALFSDYWNPRIVGNYNGNEIRLAKIMGEFSWHSHQNTDELFFVLSGELAIEFRDRTVTLLPGEMIVVPKGTEHRPAAAVETHILLMDREGEPNTGEQPGEYTRAKLEQI